MCLVEDTWSDYFSHVQKPIDWRNVAQSRIDVESYEGNATKSTWIFDFLKQSTKQINQFWIILKNVYSNVSDETQSTFEIVDYYNFS